MHNTQRVNVTLQTDRQTDRRQYARIMTKADHTIGYKFKKVNSK